MPSAPLHTIVIVELPPLHDVIKALQEDALSPTTDITGNGHHPPSSNDASADGQASREDGEGVPSPTIAGRSLPLLFIRASDGVGYHSGRTIACENVFQTMELGLSGNPTNATGGVDTGWLAAAQVAAADSGLHGWTLRVM
jgi:recombining binding protein (suppressor of hairless)